MADKKVSELLEATSAALADVFLVVQGGVSKRITKTNLFKKSQETLTTTTVVSPAIDTTLVDNTLGSTLNLTLAVGAEGMTKTIILSANTGTVGLTVTGGLGFSTIGFDSVGSTVTLHFVNGSWAVISSHNVTIA